MFRLLCVILFFLIFYLGLNIFIQPEFLISKLFVLADEDFNYSTGPVEGDFSGGDTGGATPTDFTTTGDTDPTNSGGNPTGEAFTVNGNVAQFDPAVGPGNVNINAETYNAQWNPETNTVTVTGPEGSRATVQDNGDGTYTVSFASDSGTSVTTTSEVTAPTFDFGDSGGDNPGGGDGPPPGVDPTTLSPVWGYVYIERDEETEGEAYGTRDASDIGLEGHEVTLTRINAGTGLPETIYDYSTLSGYYAFAYIPENQEYTLTHTTPIPVGFERIGPSSEIFNLTETYRKDFGVKQVAPIAISSIIPVCQNISDPANFVLWPSFPGAVYYNIYRVNLEEESQETPPPPLLIGSAITQADSDFSARWTKTENFTPGTYKFNAVHDAGFRVYVDNTLVYNKWDQTEECNDNDGNCITYMADPGGTGTFNINITSSGTSAPTPPPAGGPTPSPFTATFFNNQNLTGSPVVTRSDPEVNFDWGSGSPGSGINNDNFSGRWTKTEYFSGGDYIFNANHDDGMRIFIDNQIIYDNWDDGEDYSAAGNRNFTKNINQGNRTIKVEYKEGGGNAKAQINWQLSNAPSPAPSGSPTPTFTEGEHTIKVEYWDAGSNAAAILNYSQIAGSGGFTVSETPFVSEYFNNKTLTGTPVLTKDEDKISFFWGSSTPWGVNLGSSILSFYDEDVDQVDSDGQLSQYTYLVTALDALGNEANISPYSAYQAVQNCKNPAISLTSSIVRDDNGNYSDFNPRTIKDGKSVDIGYVNQNVTSCTASSVPTQDSWDSDATNKKVLPADNFTYTGTSSQGTFTYQSEINNDALTLTSNLKTHWDMDENTGPIIDSIEGLSANINSHTSHSPNSKVGAKALSFSSYEAEFEVEYANVDLTPHKELFKSDPLSISLWIKPTSTNNTQTVFWAGEGGGDGFGQHEEFHISIENNTISVYLGDNNNHSTAGNDVLLAGAYIDPNNYHLITLTLNNGTAKLYLDGDSNPIAIDTYEPSISKTNWDNAYLGRSGTGAGAFLGLMDEFSLWNKALSDTDIPIIYGNDSGITLPYLDPNVFNYTLACINRNIPAIYRQRISQTLRLIVRSALLPYIQTTGGDIHTNKYIDIPQ